MATSENDSLLSLYRLIIPSLESPCTLGIALCTDFKELISIPTLLSKGINVCIIDAKLIVSIETIFQAIFKAICCNATGKMKTKAIATEILLNISPYKQIKQSLITFGVGNQPSKVWVISLSEDPASEIKNFLELTDSRMVLQEPRDVCDEEAIKELYSVTNGELAIGSLEEAIMNRIAIKDL